MSDSKDSFLVTSKVLDFRLDLLLTTAGGSSLKDVIKFSSMFSYILSLSLQMDLARVIVFLFVGSFFLSWKSFLFFSIKALEFCSSLGFSLSYRYFLLFLLLWKLLRKHFLRYSVDLNRASTLTEEYKIIHSRRLR